MKSLENRAHEAERFRRRGQPRCFPTQRTLHKVYNASWISPISISNHLCHLGLITLLRLCCVPYCRPCSSANECRVSQEFFNNDFLCASRLTRTVDLFFSSQADHCFIIVMFTFMIATTFSNTRYFITRIFAEVVVGTTKYEYCQAGA